MTEKRIASVVTGANGFVGSHMVDLLLEKGHSVKCIVRKTSDLKWLTNKPVEIIDSGLFNLEELKSALKDADYLYHIAGVVKAKKQEDYYRGNVETTRNLLDTLLEVNPGIKKVVALSSLTAAGPSENGIHITENSEPHPITTYGRSKLAQERLIKSYCEKLPITIVRPPAIYGERDTEIYLFFKTYMKGLMSLVGFNRKLISIIHVTDLVNGVYLAGESAESAGQIYFIGSEKYYTWPEIGNAIFKATGKKVVTLRLPHFLIYGVAAAAQFFSMFSSKAATFNIEKAKDFVQQYWTCDVSKAKRDLGFAQNISLEDGIKRTIEWYKEMKWL